MRLFRKEPCAQRALVRQVNSSACDDVIFLEMLSFSGFVFVFGVLDVNPDIAYGVALVSRIDEIIGLF